MAILKVLVFGNVDESLEEAIIKGNTLTKSKNGPFNTLILLATQRVLEQGADTFAKLRAGSLPVDLPVNIVITDEAAKEIEFEHDKVRILYSGARQVRTLKALDGLTLGWVGHGAPGHVDGPKLVDIFLSGSVPAHANPTAPPNEGHRALAGVLATRMFPRYHFAPGQEFFERPPYKSSLHADLNDDGKVRLTRFITLGTFGGKARWFYAFNLDLDESKSVDIPAGTTVNPYEEHRQQMRQEKNSNNNHDIRDKDRESHKRSRQDGRSTRPTKRQIHVVSPSECFLCLSNPTLESHLITSIADNTYLALAKGPLLEASTQPNKIPGHFIVVPISHVPALPIDKSVREALEVERARYVSALHQLFNAQATAAGKTDGVVTVAFDMSRPTGVHYHTQVMAVSGAHAAELEKIFEKYQQVNEIDNASISPELASEATNFFRFQITRSTNTHDENDASVDESKDKKRYGTTTTTFVIALCDDPHRRFDIQFGRRVVADALSLTHRMDWRACAQTKTEEEQDAFAFKAVFKEIDPAIHADQYS